MDGNVIATDAATLYLGGMTIHGNLISTGGGDPGRNFPIKDDQVDGNVIQSWSGLWLAVAQTGGSGGSPNAVGGHKLGECAGL